MDCETAREAVSAVMDGEVPGSPVADLQEHLAGCAACRVWREAAHEVTRRARIAPAAAAPQRTGEVLAALRARARLPRRRLVTVAVVRAGLAVVAAAQIGITVPVLLFGRDHSAPEHVAHEMGSFGVFARAWADHEAMLTGLDELTQRAGKLREWVTAWSPPNTTPPPPSNA